MTAQLDQTTLENEAQEGEETKKTASGLHSAIIMKLGSRLAVYIEDNKLGYAFESSATYDFNDGQPKRLPDASFVSFANMPVRPADTELTAIPDLALEVVSKNDTVYEVLAKVLQYQQAGVRLIWIVYPPSQTVSIYRQATGLVEEAIGINGELDGEEVLPGFKLAVRSLFEW